MKKFITLSILMFAFITNAKAWEPVLVEKHWFSFYEYDNPWLKTDNGIHYEWNDGYLLSLKGAFMYDGDVNDEQVGNGVQWNNEKWCTTTYYSILDHKPRFSVDNTNAWKVGRLENHWAYQSYGLQNITDNATNFTIHDLEVGDTIIFEYYRENGDADGQVTLAGGSLQNINNGQSIYGTNEYVCNAQGNITFSCPKHMLLRSVTIKLAEYEAAETEITEIAESERANYEGATGYRFTIKSAGVLEDRRCAVPYMTMRIGDAENNNDLVYVRNLGTANEYGEQFGAGCIISDKDDLDVSKLSHHYESLSQETTNKMLPGKEWTVFKAERASEGYSGATWDDDTFNSIYPIYGTYYYFFPEVDGYINVRFYCEGNREHAPLWYKQNGNDFIAANAQPTLTYTNGNGDNTKTIDGSYEDQNYYEYTMKVEKGGVYYLCSNPTLLHQQRPTVRLMSYAFMPLFRLDPLWYVANDTEKANHAVTNAAELNQDFTVNGTKNIIHDVKCLGNIQSAEPYFVPDNANNKAKLCFRNIVYKREYLNDPTLNDGGAVVVHVECEEGKAKFVLTVPYSAEKAIAATDANNHYLRVMDTDTKRNPGGKQVKKWDFFSNIYEVGQYSDPNSQLYNEIHKADGGLTADWVETYVNIEKGEEPIFKSVYDMEGDNADMLHETEGLVFFTDANVLGIYNENNPSTSTFADRYIGLMNGGEFWVPNLKSGDRIVVKMGVYGKSDNSIETQNATLHIENATDAVGTPLSSVSGDNIQFNDYVIGGSGVAAGNDTNGGNDITDMSQPWGEYHFISTGGHFKLKVAETTELLKIYSIVIYKNSINPDNILTENELLGDEEHRQILNTQDFTTAVDNVQLHMHYRGLQEETNYAQKKAKTGNLSDGDIQITSMTSNESLWYTFFANVTLPITPDKAKFGVFKARLGVQTMDEEYVTDYADCMIPVGYRETKTYPYTWDFTDLKKYVGAGIETATGEGKKTGDELVVTEDDLKIWDDWNLRVKPDEWDGNIFASGGQLYGGTTMFDETRGIGIFFNNTDNKAMTMNGNPNAEDGGLAVTEEFGFVVPKVKAGQAVYVHATAGDDATAQYAIGNGTKQTLTKVGTNAFAMKMGNNASTSDVTLYFKGCEVNKIAVATDEKKTNIKGYASESRDHAIDASLLPYFTGKAMKSYLVSNPNYEEHTLMLTDVSNTESYVIPANTGYVIYNPDNANDTGEFNPFWDGKEATVADKGFHLFVPDMHDDEEAEGKFAGVETNNDFMVPVLEERTGDNKLMSFSSDGKKTNYVLSYKWYDLTPDGRTTGQQHTGDEMFYRVSKEGINLRANSAYLVLDTESLGLKTSQGSIQGSTQSAKFTFVFSDWSDVPVVPTTIENHGTMETFEDGNVEWHNLSGQKLNGKPSVPGLYIVNGKKVLVK